jgi:hypothetical protein
MNYIQSDFRLGDLIELHDSTECTIYNYHPNVLYIVVCNPSKKKPYSIPINQIKQIISVPLPLEIGDCVIKSGRSPKQNKRGGKREGAGRKPTGNPPKKRKALQLEQSLAAKLPDLPSLAALLEEFRPIAESGQLRSQKLADFYKKLDLLPTIV